MARAKQFLRRIFGSRFGGDGDPYARVAAPKPRRPGGRSAAVAVMEPDDDVDVTAVGIGRTRTGR
jgi:hypothetical protein